MRRNNLLINLGLVFSLLFCLAFACNSGESGTTQPTSRTTQDTTADDDEAKMTTDVGVGAKYGTRDPRICADTKAPTGGAMTAKLATEYLICSSEGVQGDNLFLIEGLTTVQVGGGVPYNPRTYPYAHDIDPEALVYPLRVGSYKSYLCAVVNEGNNGFNCSIFPYPKGTGVCLKSTFGDWSCTMSYQDVDRSQVENNVQPPQ